MKSIYKWTILLTLLFTNCLSNAEDKEILEIRNQFKLWQQALQRSDISSQKFYHVYYGDYFEKEEWVDSVEAIKDGFVGEEVSVYIDSKLGISLKVIETSPSGDWSISSEHYYWPSQKLFFVFWAMNTFQAEEPVTVERRLYFNLKGEVIRRLESVYKMNSRVQIEEPDYFDRETMYWLKVDSIPFKKLLKIGLKVSENSLESQCMSNLG